MTQFTSATFYDTQTANKAINAIIAMDYPRDRINVILSRQTRRRFWDAVPRDQQTVKPMNTIGASDDTIASLLASSRATVGTEKGAAAADDNDDEAVIIVGPAASSSAANGAEARGSSRVLDVLTRLGLARGDAERLYGEIKSGGIVVGVSTSNGDRAGVEQAMQNNTARTVMESTTAR